MESLKDILDPIGKEIEEKFTDSQREEYKSMAERIKDEK